MWFVGCAGDIPQFLSSVKVPGLAADTAIGSKYVGARQASLMHRKHLAGLAMAVTATGAVLVSTPSSAAMQLDTRATVRDARGDSDSPAFDVRKLEVANVRGTAVVTLTVKNLTRANTARYEHPDAGTQESALFNAYLRY